MVLRSGKLVRKVNGQLQANRVWYRKSTDQGNPGFPSVTLGT